MQNADYEGVNVPAGEINPAVNILGARMMPICISNTKAAIINATYF